MDIDIQVPIASLGQYSFCPRRCALMYVENLMFQNSHTVEGTILHQHVDDGADYSRSQVKQLHALPLYSDKYGLVGKADLVEIRNGKPMPIEFKKGKKSNWENNHIQLCAQALCLEEMFACQVTEGAIFNLASKKRVKVVFSTELIEKTCATIVSVRDLFITQFTPLAEHKPRCDGCSLYQICLPEIASQLARSVLASARKRLFSIGADHE